jgi:DNA-directed RNA polymerase subunit K/omega
MNEGNIIEGYEDINYDLEDSSNDISDTEENTIIPSYDVPDSIEFYKNYSNHSNQKITDPCLTKYEKTKVLAERTQQIEDGSILYIPLTDKLTTAYSIALEEFKQKKIPFIICRPLPNSSGFEYWKLNELIY